MNAWRGNRTSLVNRINAPKSPTEKQIELIKRMEHLLDIKFVGATVGDASKFISENIECYKEKQEFVFDMTYYEDAY